MWWMRKVYTPVLDLNLGLLRVTVEHVRYFEPRHLRVGLADSHPECLVGHARDVHSEPHVILGVHEHRLQRRRRCRNRVHLQLEWRRDICKVVEQA